VMNEIARDEHATDGAQDVEAALPRGEPHPFAGVGRDLRQHGQVWADDYREKEEEKRGGDSQVDPVDQGDGGGGRCPDEYEHDGQERSADEDKRLAPAPAGLHTIAPEAHQRVGDGVHDAPDDQRRSEGTGRHQHVPLGVGGVGPIALQQPRQRHVRGQGDTEIAHTIQELMLPGYAPLNQTSARRGLIVLAGRIHRTSSPAYVVVAAIRLSNNAFGTVDLASPPQGPHVVGVEFNRLAQLGCCFIESVCSLRRQGLLNESFALLH